MAIAVGARFDHFEVIAPLGAGGMGEVYLARDTRLDRRVALKLLPAEFTTNRDRVRRFEQEAKAASSLNHPNIITVYEIGEADGAHFIATEYVDGQTLRQRMKNDQLKLPSALDVAVQIASALAAAHEAGTIHRDIKPENVMLRRDGIVKVLDFGLAKLTERRQGEVDNEAPTRAKVNTDPGTVMGTASYMSPEQARGQEVDARSDIFSLGVMLYEMLAGRAPFIGVNALEVIGEILKTEPPPLRAHTPDAPADLQRIVGKALRKDRDERYQHVKDLLIDLKDLKQEIEFEAKLKGAQAFVVPPSGGSGEAREIPPEGGTTNAQPAQAATNEAPMARTSSSAEIILSEIKRHKTGAFFAIALLVLAFAGAAFGLYKLLNPDSAKPTTTFEAMKLTRLTAHGQAVAAAISPDGKYVVYAKQEPTGQSLWLRQIAINNSDVQIAPPQETGYRSFTYSHDGNFIYYVEGRLNEFPTLYRMSALGRNPTKLLADRSFNRITLSPDGQQMAFIRTYPGRANDLIVASADGKEARVLATGDSQRGDLFHAVAWSPDGQSIACNAIVRGDGVAYQTVVAVNVTDGRQRILTSQRWTSVSHINWLPDGSGLLVIASEVVTSSRPEIGANRQLWRLALPTGEARRLTNDLSDYDSLSLAADAGSLVALQKEDSFSLWVMPKGDASRAQQLPRASKDDGDSGLAWTPDGRIVYASTVGGQNGLWLVDAAGGNQKQLDVGSGWQPTVSADGRWLAFVSTRAGGFNIWRTELSGGGLKKLTDQRVSSNPSFTPDAKWVVYSHNVGDKVTVWRVSLEGGASVQLNEQYSRTPALSPDGKLIAFIAVDEQRRGSLALMPFEGGPALKTFELLPTISAPAGLRWTPDGRAVTYVSTRGGVSNIWGQPLSGGAPKQLTDFKTEQIRAFAWSRDGQLAVSRGVVNSDVVLISGFK